MTENVSLPEQNVLNNDDTVPTASNSDVSNSIIHLDKDELLDKLYKLNEDNLLLSEQLKQYRVMVQTLENKSVNKKVAIGFTFSLYSKLNKSKQAVK